MEYVAKGKDDGSTPSTSTQHGEDALTLALGKKDHRGYVKVASRYGVGVGLKRAFGKGPRQRKDSTEAQMAQMQANMQAQMEQMQAQMQAQVQAQVQALVQAQVQAHMAQMQAQMASSQLPTMANLPIQEGPPPLPPLDQNVCFVNSF